MSDSQCCVTCQILVCVKYKFFSVVLQIIDLTQLRSSDGFQEVEATAIYSGFGQCLNLAANSQTNFVYGLGATSGDYPNNCGGVFLN